MKKTMKKAISVTISSVLSLSLLAGCGGAPAVSSSMNSQNSASASEIVSDGKQYEGVKLVYWVGQEATVPFGVTVTEAAKAFEEATGAEVQLEFKGNKGIPETFVASYDAGQQIDIIDGVQNKSAYGDRLICLEDLVKQADYEKNTNPALMAQARSYWEDGKLYEIPYTSNYTGYMYNKALFKQAGVDKVPATQEEFLEVCQKLKDAGITPLTTDDAYAPQAFGYHLARLLGQEGVLEVVHNGEWDKPEVLQTAQFFEELASNGYFSSQVGSNVWPTGQNTEFGASTVAMYCVPTFVVNELKTIVNDDFEWGYFAYPEVDGGINGLETVTITASTMAITSRCENPEAAFALIEWITRGEWDAKIAQECITVPMDITNEYWPEELIDVKPYASSITNYQIQCGGVQDNADILPSLKENLIKLYAGTCTAEDFVANMMAAANA